MDYIAALFELVGLVLIGNKSKFGFIFALIGGVIWIYVAISSNIYGLLIVVLPAIAINLRNYLKWYKMEYCVDE